MSQAAVREAELNIIGKLFNFLDRVVIFTRYFYCSMFARRKDCKYFLRNYSEIFINIIFALFRKQILLNK